MNTILRYGQKHASKKIIRKYFYIAGRKQNLPTQNYMPVKISFKIKDKDTN